MGKINLKVIVALCLMYVMPIECHAQELVSLKYIVQRGETIELLAERYGLTEDMLKRVNDGMDIFYTGMEVQIPIAKRYLEVWGVEYGETILKELAGYLAGYHEATEVFDKGDYKKASKMYAATIHAYGKHLPCDEAYFAIAMCNYNRKKWSSAIDGFTHVIGIDGCSDELRDYSRRLRDEAEEQREARRERTDNFFGGLLQAAAEVGTAYMAASQQNVMDGGGMGTMPQGKSLGSMSNAEFTTYVNSSLAQIANISVIQVQQRWAQEELQFKNSFIANYRRMHGCAPSSQEVQAAYNDYMQSKANAYNTVQRVSSGLYDKELGINSDSSMPSSRTTPHTNGGYKCKKISATDKAHCNDTGVCQVCNGRKVTQDMYGNTIDCTVCYRTGKCPSCQGRR